MRMSTLIRQMLDAECGPLWACAAWSAHNLTNGERKVRRESVKVFPSSACYATKELWHVDGPIL